MQTARRSTSSGTAIYYHQLRRIETISAITNETSYVKSWREIPGPSSLPIIGQLFHFLPGGHLYNLSEPLANALYKKYGPIVRLQGFFGSTPMIFTFDAEVASYILRSENRLPIRPGLGSLNYYRKVYKKNDDPDVPTGLLTDHGEIWKKFRSTVNPIMLQPKTIKLYQIDLNEVADDMIKRLKLIRNENNMIVGKFDVEMNLWALESVGVVALGSRLNCLEPNLPADSPARKLIKVVEDVFKTFYNLDINPSMWRYLSTPAFKRAMQTYEDQITLSTYFIEKAIIQYESKDKSPNEKSVLEKLLDINKDVAVLIASDMLLAGIDTTANTVIATLYLLAVNPKKQEKLRAEIVSQQDQRPYLRACLKESMRLMPLVTGSVRQTSKEYNILGYKIPKDMPVLFGHQVLSMMEEHFPRPTEYIPERWVTHKGDQLYHGNAGQFAFSPFGYGARSCIGRRFAEIFTETFVAKVIKNFEVEWFGPPLKTKFFTINYAVPPFNFIFKDAK